MSNKDVDAIRRSIRSDQLRKLYDHAYGDGWLPSVTGSGHIRLRAPKPHGRYSVTFSASSDGSHRTVQNVRAYFRRGGLKV